MSGKIDNHERSSRCPLATLKSHGDLGPIVRIVEQLGSQVEIEKHAKQNPKLVTENPNALA